MRVAFVSAPTGSPFMAEILASAADAVRRVGASAITHSGTVDEVDDGATAFVVVPHEYFVLSPRPTDRALRRTIAFGVEHPGTETFSTAVAAAALCEAHFEIGEESVAAMRSRGFDAHRFVLGYSPEWDHWRRSTAERTTDIAYLGTVDERRLRVLARIAPQWSDLRTVLLTPPHEVMSKPRPDFLTGAEKWRFLATTKVLLNLHREAKTALEWVRVLEAMCNGCVIVTEPSTDLGPIVPGQHLLVADRSRIGAVARAVVGDEELRRTVADRAYLLCREQFDMSASAARLAEVAEGLVVAAQRQAEVEPVTAAFVSFLQGPPVEAWLPVPHPLPHTIIVDTRCRETAQHLARLRRRVGKVSVVESVGLSPTAKVDLLCVQHATAGPLWLTAASVARQALPINLHVACLGGPRPEIAWLSTFASGTSEASIGSARNVLAAASVAPYVLVLDAGDELLPGSLGEMLSLLDDSPGIAISYCMAASGTDGLVNTFMPESRRLERHGYLTRGYLIRRSWLEQLGCFCPDPVLDPYVDHDIWLRSSRRGAMFAHVNSVGIRLWPADSSHQPVVDAGDAERLLNRR
ncbi:MAG: glycosyltransferase family protein [Solirubrobacteraceae bacterium]